jgi:predicted DNA-binding antitoxin AbrB/MazE fold protein
MFSDGILPLMSVKARYTNGVFEPLEEVLDARPGKVYRVFSEEELRSLAEGLTWLTASEKSFEFWSNEEDAVYDKL